jgi:spore coat-associated protein N
LIRKALVLFLVAGLLAEFAGGGSALFTGSAAVAANTFTAGTVIISTNPTTALVSFSNMAPGDQVTAPVTVSNTGSLALRYAITSTATNADGLGLMSQLGLTIKSSVTTCTDAGFGSSGNQLYTGALGSIAGINVVGNPAQGQQAGDRTLNANTNEILCFNVLLPSGTNNSYQGATTTATFTFNAEQTANNP